MFKLQMYGVYDCYTKNMCVRKIKQGAISKSRQQEIGCE